VQEELLQNWVRMEGVGKMWFFNGKLTIPRKR